MNDADFMRYSRQLLLEDISLDGQQKLLNASVLIIGLGGLGSPAALYLAGAGVGTLLIADDDQVHISNLQRQILFTVEDVDQPKTTAARHQLQRINPDIKVIPLHQRLAGAALLDAVTQADVVLDCSDNMATRQAVNAACVAASTPLITASAVGFTGQLMVLTPPWQQGCYRCLWQDEHEPEHNCRTAGILGPVVGVMGTLQALETIKLLTGLSPASGALHLFDARRLDWRALRMQKSPHCPICGETEHADSV
ncbi:HesA/MoeB/ThiF family protein [Citrobacter sp. JGM124]|uniref:HesA/MoeB/ThiF family protein n=1 Tax=Citrobacter sp. JGM124 TaxID=2799789 RepID=UPI001BA4BFE5|nr:HesA/MoeB/ThiF family protein [Citrobacter sp. JGM124]MBS0850040.1 HesA/MoeB/ThiF family protein [Citrobacter sp. JGM124]